MTSSVQWRDGLRYLAQGEADCFRSFQSMPRVRVDAVRRQKIPVRDRLCYPEILKKFSSESVDTSWIRIRGGVSLPARAVIRCA